MAFQSAFRERLKDMDTTRNQRLTNLQDEQLLHKNKSFLLASKHAHIRSLEQRCLLLDQKFASQNFKISSLKSEIEFLERKYQNYAQQLRDLRIEVDDLERLDEERENYYGRRSTEMAEFRNAAERFSTEICIQVEDLRSRRDELNSTYNELQKSGKEVEDPDLKAAEIRKSELLVMKAKVNTNLESNKRLRDELLKQVQSLR